ncbi:MAG: hypothetical protein IT233_02685 [Bacteroidia bacterium]|nr:hypothetical protein [Bacteroidia bacterium]
MKFILRHSILFVMILLTLAAGGGFTLSRMICTGSGHTTYELGQMKKCKKDPDHHNACVSPDCCLMSVSEMNTGAHTATVKPESSDEPIQIVGIPFLSPASDSESEGQDEKPSDFDPPNLGVSILRLIQILLI